MLSTADVPTSTEVSGIVGEHEFHTLDELKAQREQAIVFEIAKEALERFYRDDDGNLRPWLFPQLVAITRRWLSECVRCKDNTYPQLLLLSENKNRAAEKIRLAIDEATAGQRTLKPILRPYDYLGSTRFIDFDTTKPTYSTNPLYCHVSHVASDSGWEIVMAERLEEMEEVVAYVKNQGAGFYIPYTVNGEERGYLPDFIVRIDDGNGPENLLNLVIEVTGQPEKDKEVKVTTAKTLWTPAINNHGGFGRWEFLEVKDPWDAKNLVRARVRGARV